MYLGGETYEVAHTVADTEIEGATNVFAAIVNLAAIDAAAEIAAAAAAGICYCCGGKRETCDITVTIPDQTEIPGKSRQI